MSTLSGNTWLQHLLDNWELASQEKYIYQAKVVDIWLNAHLPKLTSRILRIS